jgi:hypothetical protein
VTAPKLLQSCIDSLGVEPLRPVTGFPCETWCFDVPGHRAEAVWQRIRSHTIGTGYWPVIIGDYGGSEFGGSPAVIERFIEGAESIRDTTTSQLEFLGIRQTPAETLAAAIELPFEKWAERQLDPAFQLEDHFRKARYFDGIEGASSMANLQREFAEHYRNRPKWEFDPEHYPVPPKPNRTKAQHRLHCILRYDAEQPGGVVTESVTILLIPTRNGWEVPAYLSYATCELERQPHVHVAALKWLADEFGAELVGLEDRIIEVVPKRRPRDYRAALLSAAYLCAYSACAATSEYENASTAEIAVYLTDSIYWTFCWP